MPGYQLPKFAPESWLTNCYICNSVLTKSTRTFRGTRTLEHVIPQWMSKKYEIGRIAVSIEGDRRVTYKNYVVPCCRICNCNLLGPIEKSLKKAFLDAGKGPASVSRRDLSIWCCKILSAARKYSELLRAGIPDAEADGVYESYGNGVLHRRIGRDELAKKFVGMLSGRVEVSSGERMPFVPSRNLDFPFSMESFRTKVPEKIEHQFDYHLDTELYAMYLRFGSWTMLACLDGGYIAYHAHEYFERYRGFELAPLQAEEMAAHFFNMASTSRCYLNYVSKPGAEGVELLTSTVSPIENPFTEPEDHGPLVYWLRHFTKQPKIRWVSGVGLITWLAISKGKLFHVGADESAGYR